jgi:hypothetical protein
MTKDESYVLGFRHGSDSEQPNTRTVFSDREAYFEGYVAGADDRDKRMAGGEGHVPRPDWMTQAQFDAIDKLYQRSADGSRDRRDFFSRVSQCGIGSDRYAGINWGRMFVGIEPDGYTHT